MSSHTSTFLGLPAELRNTVYWYTLNASPNNSIRPPALTRVNQQIRRETLIMYYSRVTCLEVPVRTLEDINRAKRWVNEVDMRWYSVLPDIRLAPPSHLIQISGIRCLRKEINVGQELSEYRHPSTKKRTEQQNMRVLYRRFLGVTYTGRVNIGKKITERFREAALEGGGWVMRDVRYEKSSLVTHADQRSANDTRLLYAMFARLVAAKDGREWDKGDLQKILDFFEESIYSHEDSTRSQEA